MLAGAPRKSRAATCEEWDEDAQTTLPDTRTSANVAAKRSELMPVKHNNRRRTADGDAGKMNRRSTDTQDDASSRKEKRTAGVKINASISERESRLYSSGPPLDRRRSSTSRPPASRSTSKAEKPEPFIRHQLGECWICDRFGYHMIVPLQPPGPSTDILQSTLPNSQQQTQQVPVKPPRPEASTAQPRINVSKSCRAQRPMSYHAGMSQESYQPLSLQAFPAPDWNMPPATILPYAHTSFALPPTMTTHNPYQDYQQTLSTQYNQQAPAPTRPRLAEVQRGTTFRGHPVIQQSPILKEQPSLTRKRSQRDQRHSRNPSLSREEDARRMAPPQSKPESRRPSMIKASTSTTAPSLYRERRYSTYGSGTLQTVQHDRRPEPPPSSYRERPVSAHRNLSQDRSVPQKAVLREDSEPSRKANSSAPALDRRTTTPNRERNEAEAEKYQLSRGTKAQTHPLTMDAVSTISRHSDSGSQRSINTSSRGSSGGKTKATAATNDITMTINGLTLGISGDSAENHSIKIQSQRNGGVSIRVNENEMNKENKLASLPRRSGSINSTSRQSQKGNEKVVRRPRAESSDRGIDRAVRPSSKSRQTSYDDSLGYGFGYG